MAPRRHAKQAAAESVVAAANGNVTPPKKRKTAAKSAATEKPRQAMSRTRQAKADKQENEVAGEPSFSPKKLRSRQKSAAATAPVAARTDTKSKSKKPVNKKSKDAAMENNNAGEVAEKKARGGKAAATAKKAGTKATAAKPKANMPTGRKRKTEAKVENGAGASEKNAAGEGPAKRTTRRAKAVEESDAPVLPTAKVSRKRRNMGDMDEAITEEQIAKEEEEKMANKKLRGRAKKEEIDDAPKPRPKGRPKKNPAKEIAEPPSEETGINTKNDKEQNEAVQEDDEKTKNAKIAKKGNAKKAAPRGKLTVTEKANDVAVPEEANDVEAEEVATSEVDVKENGEAHVAEPKQKKKNAGKANAAMNGKIEAKGKQKKEQAAVVSNDEEEATNEPTETTIEPTEMNVTSEVDGNGIKDGPLSEDDSVLLNEEEENRVNESKDNSTKDELSPKSDTSTNGLERSGSFIRL